MSKLFVVNKNLKCLCSPIFKPPSNQYNVLRTSSISQVSREQHSKQRLQITPGDLSYFFEIAGIPSQLMKLPIIQIEHKDGFKFYEEK